MNSKACISTLDRIRRVSSIMRYAIVITSVLLVVGNAVIWAFAGWLEMGIVAGLAIPPGIPVNMSVPVRIAGFLFSSVIVGVLVFGLWRAKALFDEFAEGHLFTARGAACLKTVARVTIFLAAMGPLSKTLLVLLFTASNPKGQKILQIGISSNDLMVAMIGGLLFAIALVMGEAAQLADDNAQIV